MLNLPLSLLSDDLLSYIVDHVAERPFSGDDLYNLSITDRAFTRSCQAHIFKNLHLGCDYGNKDVISGNLAKIRNIFNDEPSFAHWVRTVHLTVSFAQNKWFFNDPNFITIFQLLAKSLMPPHKLHLSGHGPSYYSCIIEDPILVVGRLMQSFFSQTLSILNLTACGNVPLTIFLVCPNLKAVYLEDVGAFDSRDNEYPDTQCSGRESPSLEHLNYRKSESLVKQMITPPPKFAMAVVDWSKLRVLKLCPQERKEMMCLQPILDAACNTLEELYLTNRSVPVPWGIDEQRSLAGLVDLRHLPNLHIFAIYAIINCYAHRQEPVVLSDIDLILSTIPKANQVTKLSLDFTIYGEHPYGRCLEEDWVGMCDKVVRISAGKPLELDLEMEIIPHGLYKVPSERDELYERIKEKMASLSDCPNICQILNII